MVCRPNNTICYFGDSITGLIGPYRQKTDSSYQSKGFIDWAQNLSGQRLQSLLPVGVPGQRSDEALARIVGDVIAQQPGYCHVLIGTNDSGVLSLEQTKANLTAIWTTLSNAGIVVLAGTIPPRNVYADTPTKAARYALNQWIRDQGRKLGIVVVDHAAVLDIPQWGASAGWNNQSINTADGIHPTTIAAALMGQALAQAINFLVPPNPPLTTSETDGVNFLQYNRFVGGGSGSVPTGWTANSFGTAPTYSKTARTDNVPGSWQTIAVANGEYAGYLTSTSSSVDGSAVAVGDQIVGTLEYSLSNLGVAETTQRFYIAVRFWNGSVWSYVYDLQSVDNHPAWSRSGVARTPPATVPAGTQLIQLAIYLLGGGTYNLDRASLVNISKWGIAA